MWYSEDDWYEMRQQEKAMDNQNIKKGFDDIWSDDFGNITDETPMSLAKEIMDELENNPDVMDAFNLLLRQKKLKQLKDK